MKTTQKIISYVLVLITVFSSFTILPSEFWGWADVSAVDLQAEESNAIPLYKEGNYTYSIINANEVKLVKYDGGKSVVIPSVTKGSECPELANKKVTAIGDNVFAEKQINSVTFGKNIKSIGNYTFYRNDTLKTVDLSVCTGLTSIGVCAFFQNYELTTLKLPDSLKIIDNNAFGYCRTLKELVIGNKIESIGASAFSSCFSLTTVKIKSGNSAVIGKSAFESCSVLTSITIGDGVKRINDLAFCYCTKLKEVKIGKDITYMGYNVFRNCFRLEKVNILGEELTTLYEDSIPNNEVCVIYCYQDSTTYNSLKDNGFVNFTLYTRRIYPIDIKVNGASLENFNKNTENYTAYVDDIADVNIVPIFEESIKYTVTEKNNVYTINIYDDDDNIFYSYKVTVEEYKYTVTGDVNLTLNSISATKVIGNVALQAGTYKLKIAKGTKQLGYNKTVADFCNGLTLKEGYASYITLNATGGTYTFQLDTKTKKLVIKYDSNLPNEYLVGDLVTILKPVGNRPLAIGSQQLQKGTYKFKLSIGGKEYGYNKIVNDATTGTLTVNSKYTSYITLNATGGMYIFTLNTETNGLIINHIPTDNEKANDVHISGTFDLVLDKISSSIFTETKYLSNGCYTFKVYDYGVAYTAGAVIQNEGGCTLSSRFTTPITLNTNGGYYKFTFDRKTGVFAVILLP